MSIVTSIPIIQPVPYASLDAYFRFLDEYFTEAMRFYQQAMRDHQNAKDLSSATHAALELIRTYPLERLFYPTTIQGMWVAVKQAYSMHPRPTKLTGYLELPIGWEHSNIVLISKEVRLIESIVPGRPIIDCRYGKLFLGDEMPHLRLDTHHVYIHHKTKIPISSNDTSYELVITDRDLDQFNYTESKMLIGEEAISTAQSVLKKEWPNSWYDNTWSWSGVGTVNDPIYVHTEFYSGDPRWDGTLTIKDGQISEASCDGGGDSDEAAWNEDSLRRIGTQLIQHGVWNITINMEGND